MSENKHLIAPYGGALIDLLVPESRAAELKAEAAAMPSWDLGSRQQMQLALLMHGAYSPLAGFMKRADYEGVLSDMRLADGTFWPLPVTLDIDAATAAKLAPGASLALRDLEGVLLAVLHVEELWTPDREAEALALYGTTDGAHPGVDAILGHDRAVYVGGWIAGVEPPTHHAFKALRHTPAELRAQFSKLGWRQVVAFHTREPIHQAQQRLSLHVAREQTANLLLHPAVDETEDYYGRVRGYREVTARFPAQTTLLSIISLPQAGAGARELLLHAIARQNHGCTHMVWEDGAYDVQPQSLRALREAVGDALAIQLLACERWVYIEGLGDYRPAHMAYRGKGACEISRDELLGRLADGVGVPEWFSYPEVMKELEREHPSRARQGFTLFFTGLSGAGKSTIAKAVVAKLLELGGRPVSLLDGDVVRKNLSSELGFSREHRDLNIRRIGYVASEITKNGGIAVCAPIAPYQSMRREVRKLISQYGAFIEIHVATSLEVCEGRDRKGLYAKARAGLIKEFTGISDPYEAPEKPELRLDTQDLSVEEAAQQVFLYLEQQGFVG